MRGAYKCVDYLSRGSLFDAGRGREEEEEEVEGEEEGEGRVAVSFSSFCYICTWYHNHNGLSNVS